MSAAATYVCETSGSTCPYDCVGLADCTACECAVAQTGGGPWGSAMDVIMCLLPIVFLLVATLIPKPLPTTTSLPAAAGIMFLVRLMYLGSDPINTCAAVVKGLHEALTPLSIMAGAIMLFETMEATNCMPYMMREMKALTAGHAITELMIIFCFAYMVEGASGFGTPVALGAPMLVSLGHPKFNCVVVLLLMNTFATVWGAAGTPIWFGFGNLELSEEEFIEISYKAAVALVVAAYLLVPLLMLFLVPLQMVRQNLIFIFLSLSTAVLTGLGLSFISYEFPSLIGGMVGCGLTAVLIKFKVGLTPVELEPDESGRHPMDIGSVSEKSIVSLSMKSSTKKVRIAGDDDTENGASRSISVKNSQSFSSDVSNVEAAEDAFNQNKEKKAMSESHSIVDEKLGPRKSLAEGYIQELIVRTFPIWGTVLILVLTRVPQIGLKAVLTARDPHFTIDFNTYGVFKMSASLVVSLSNILTYPGMEWKYELLYTPFLVPFVLVSFITIGIYRNQLNQPVGTMIRQIAGRLYNPAIALFGALTLVQLLINGGESSPAHLIGTNLASAFKGGWIAIAAFVGILGSFFSGSTTISNLTFGEIQVIAAEQIGTSTTAMLALQAAGASAGNGVCLNNIISACTVVGLQVSEGKIIAQTGKIVLTFGVVATLIILAAFFRFP